MLYASFSLAFAAITLALLGWLLWVRHSTRRRAAEVLTWIESTLGSHGNLPSVQWLTGTRFRVRLRTSTAGLFNRAFVLVALAPPPTPLAWLRSAMNDAEEDDETVTFEADLDLPPRCELDLRNYRLVARTRRDLKPSPNTQGWQYFSPTPMVITSRSDWGREVTGVISSLLELRNKHFLDLRFSPHSPHLSVTLPLEAISPASLTRLEMATAIRELAVEVSSFHGLNY